MDDSIHIRIAEWLRWSASSPPDTGLPVAEALERAETLLRLIEAGRAHPSGFEPSSAKVEVLHAVCALISRRQPSRGTLAVAKNVFDFISSLDWPQNVLGGRAGLLAICALTAWRSGLRSSSATEEDTWRRTHYSAQQTTTVRAAAQELLAMPVTEWPARDNDGGWDLELLLTAVEMTREGIETSPERVVQNSTALWKISGSLSTDDGTQECSYLAGEFACLAGMAHRLLGRREQAREWFVRAEQAFEAAPNREANMARLAYQRMAVRLEERRFDDVLKFAPVSSELFMRLGLPEDALKSRFLAAIALKETERYAESTRIFREIIDSARVLQTHLLGAIASENLFQIHALLGETTEALAVAEEAITTLRRLNNRVGLAKLRLGVGYLLRVKGKTGSAIEAFRSAQEAFRDMGMRADVAATHLVLADLLLDAGQSAQAEWEIRAALPVIDELQLVPEGIAALSLLRESVRRRQIDRQALRSLNGYFEKLQS